MGSLMSQRTKVPQCPLSPWCCISRNMLCNCSGFFVAGGKKKELTETRSHMPYCLSLASASQGHHFRRVTVTQRVWAQVGVSLCGVKPGRREWQPHSFLLRSFCALFTLLGIGFPRKDVGNRCFPYGSAGHTNCALW